MLNRKSLSLLAALALGLLSLPLLADDLPPKALLDVAAKDAAARLTPTSAQVSAATVGEGAAARPVVTIKAGEEGYPGVKLTPAGSTSWDLSAYGHVAAQVTNLGTAPLTLSMRVDNAGDWHTSPWNTEFVAVAPGASATLTVIFGYQYGRQKGFALKPAAVIQVMLFTAKVKTDVKFRLDALTAAGPAGETPAAAK